MRDKFLFRLAFYGDNLVGGMWETYVFAHIRDAGRLGRKADGRIEGPAAPPDSAYCGPKELVSMSVTREEAPPLPPWRVTLQITEIRLDDKEEPVYNGQQEFVIFALDDADDQLAAAIERRKGFGCTPPDSASYSLGKVVPLHWTKEGVLTE